MLSQVHQGIREYNVYSFAALAFLSDRVATWAQKSIVCSLASLLDANQLCTCPYLGTVPYQCGDVSAWSSKEK